MSYGIVHRFLLRSVAGRGVVSFLEITEALSNSFPNKEDFIIPDLVAKINEQLKPLKQMIKIVDDDTTQQKSLVFLSIGYDAATKAQNIFTPAQLDYFRIILEEIMTIESRQITAINAINLALRGKVSITDAEGLLQIWCNLYYLEKIGNNFALGIRTIHEFEKYFQENMPESVQLCCLCKQNVFRGYNCPACDEAIHTTCLNKYTNKHQKWPCCNADFNEAHIERLNCQGMDETIHSAQNSSSIRTKKKKPNVQQNSDSDFSDHVSTTDNLSYSDCIDMPARKKVNRKTPMTF